MTMTDMVERIARVIADHDQRDAGDDWRKHVLAARAVLEEMFEPTAEMRSKGESAKSDWLELNFDGSISDDSRVVIEVWDAMIGAALETVSVQESVQPATSDPASN